MENLSFVIPFFFKGAPNPSVMLTGELRPVRNPKSESYGLYSVYTDSHFEPLNVNEELPLEKAKKLVQSNDGIFLSQDMINFIPKINFLAVEYGLRDIETVLSNSKFNPKNKAEALSICECNIHELMSLLSEKSDNEERSVIVQRLVRRAANVIYLSK